MDEATRLPVKTEKRAPVAAPAQWMSFESLRCEIDRIFNSFRLGIPFRRALEVEFRGGGRRTGASRRPSMSRRRTKSMRSPPRCQEWTRRTSKSSCRMELTIRGEKKKEKEELEKDYCLSERRYISFTRSFQVPVGVDTRKIEAAFANGVLTVKLPKTAEGWFSAIVIAALLIMGLVAYV